MSFSNPHTAFFDLLMLNSTASAAGSKIPLPGGDSIFPPKIVSTPNAVGTAVVSENMQTVGVECVDFSFTVTYR